MRLQITATALCLLVYPFGLSALTTAPAGAQAPPATRLAKSPQDSGMENVGPVDFTFQGGADYSPSQLKAFGGVTVHSANFDLQADTVTADLAPVAGKKGAVTYSQIVADADLSSGRQVTGRFEQYDLGREYLVHADHAVYVPAATTSPTGPAGTATFTGHVTLIVKAPEALAGPSVLHTDHLVMLMGPEPDYPQIQSAPGHMTFTPLQ